MLMIGCEAPASEWFTIVLSFLSGRIRAKSSSLDVQTFATLILFGISFIEDLVLFEQGTVYGLAETSEPSLHTGLQPF
jgi:uncharacterized membrane protein